MQVIFTPLARSEIVDAHDWYEARHSGLGSRFLEEVGTIVLRVEENPHQFPIVFQDVQRALLRKFPYGLFFHVENEAIVVIACFHGSRNPQRWEGRV
jgi:plasmid stabilization system protein ParE